MKNKKNKKQADRTSKPGGSKRNSKNLPVALSRLYALRDAADHARMSDDGNISTHLDGCERLKAGGSCDSVYLSQLIPLLKTTDFCNVEHVTIPTAQLDDICKLLEEPEKFVNRWVDLIALSNPKIRGISRDQAAIRNSVRNRISKHFTHINEPKNRKSLRPSKLVPNPAFFDTVAGDLQAKCSSNLDLPKPQIQHLATHPVSGIADAITQIQSTVASLPLSLPSAALPAVGFEVIYRQDWCSLGYHRGRLIRSIPLAADARRNISIKSWNVRKDRREELESVDRDISTEIIGDEKWSHAVTKQLNSDLNQQVDANAKVDGSIPIKSTGKVGATVGGESSTSGSVSGSITDIEETVHRATTKAANTLRKKTSSTIETSEEVGFESTTTETIVNPNRCNALTYHFFEIDERFDVATGIHSIAPVLLVPLQEPTITASWLLCNECLIKPHLPCSSLYEGFDAARLVTSRKLLGEFTGSLDTEIVDNAADAALGAVADVVSAYRSLKSAGINAALSGEEPNALLTGVADVISWAEDVGDDINNLAEGVKGAIDQGVDAGAKVVGGLVQNAAEGINALAGMVLPQTVSTTSNAAPAIVTEPGGPGSWLWWQMAEITSPELGKALAQLDAAYSQLATMPSGPARTSALNSALQSFFTTLGNVDDVFGKVTMGFGALAALLVASTVATAAIILPLLLATKVVAIPAALAVLGATAIGSIVGLATTLIAIASSDEVFDLVPDDRGLKAAIGGLYGLHQQLGHASALPPPPQSTDPADTAAYQQALAEVRQRRDDLATAQVELDRLLCHVREHVSYYNEVYWGAVASSDLDRILQNDFNIPPAVLEPRIVGFQDGRAAFRVNNVRWLGLSGIDIGEAMAELKESDLVDTQRQRSVIEMPTRGITLEPELGACDACDDFVEFHRTKDKDLKTQEVKQAELETRRLQERINAGLLGDPTPYEGAASLSVDVASPSIDEPRNSVLGE